LATFAYEQLLQEEANLDYVVRHEGEETCRDLLAVLERGEDPLKVGVHGICGRESASGKIVRTPLRPPIQDLDSLPICDRSLLNLSQYSVPFTILTARGCPGRCIFCSAAAMNQGYRTRSISNILTEVDYLISEYGMKFFAILDDTFTAKPDRVIEFCKAMVAGGTQRKCHWLCESRADIVTR